MDELIYKDEGIKIIGCFYAVYNIHCIPVF